MNSVKRRYAPPKAAALLQTLRGLGYSTSSAIADIVDNSLSARAQNVWIEFHWLGSSSYISILDDGQGMTDQELERALTLGARNPLEKRSDQDLGRFGMGLKSASFSQAKKLTVLSKTKSTSLSILGWDLNEMEESPNADWYLTEGLSEDSLAKVEAINQLAHGTLVLWENLDRIVTDQFDIDHFGDLIDQVSLALGMIFQRLISGSDPELKLWINSRTIKAWDPFMIGHPAKPWTSPVANIDGDTGPVSVQCHVLPHKDKLSEAEYQIAAGPNGWTAQQGFYIYRNKRLIIAGGWLGLGGSKSWIREESMRLARIRIDIPNSVDAEWSIDIKKSTARLPIMIRPWLTKLAEDTRSKARAVFAYRGKATIDSFGKENAYSAWHAIQGRNGVRYRVDTNHPAISAVLDSCKNNQALVQAMIRVIEETVPVQRIWLDTADNHDTPPLGFTSEPENAPNGVKEVLEILYLDLVNRRGLTSDAAKNQLLKTEPFNNYRHLVSDL